MRLKNYQIGGLLGIAGAGGFAGTVVLVIALLSTLWFTSNLRAADHRPNPGQVARDWANRLNQNVPADAKWSITCTNSEFPGRN